MLTSPLSLAGWEIHFPVRSLSKAPERRARHHARESVAVSLCEQKKNSWEREESKLPRQRAWKMEMSQLWKVALGKWKLNVRLFGVDYNAITLNSFHRNNFTKGFYFAVIILHGEKKLVMNYVAKEILIIYFWGSRLCGDCGHKVISFWIGICIALPK
jgi:hypothetical protein